MGLSKATKSGNKAEWEIVLKRHYEARDKVMKAAKSPPIGSWKDLITGSWAMALLKVINKLAGVGDALNFENQMIRQMQSGLSEQEAFQIVNQWEKLSANY